MTDTSDKINVYEGMFLFPHTATTNLRAAVDHIHELLKRADAEVLSFRKWDERRLAFEIKGNKRGVYFLAYFKATASSLPGLERDCNLSERILRSMFLRAEHIPAEQIEAADGRSQLEDEMSVRTEESASEDEKVAAASPES